MLSKPTSRKHLVPEDNLSWFEVPAGDKTSSCTRNQLEGDRSASTRMEKMPKRRHIVTIIFVFVGLQKFTTIRLVDIHCPISLY